MPLLLFSLDRKKKEIKKVKIPLNHELMVEIDENKHLDAHGTLMPLSRPKTLSKINENGIFRKNTSIRIESYLFVPGGFIRQGL